MEVPGWLITGGLGLLALVLLTPCLLLCYLRISLRSLHFRGRVWGLFSLTGLTFFTPQSHISVQIESIRLSYSQGKAVFHVRGVEADLTQMEQSGQAAPSRPVQGGLFALLVRILLMFVMQYVEVRVTLLSVFLPGVSCYGELMRLTLKIDHTVRTI